MTRPEISKKLPTTNDAATPRFDDPRLPRRFWDKVTVQSNGCWLWAAGTDKDGYARYSRDGQWCLAYRVSYEGLVGAVSDGFELDHVCHTRDDSCTDGSRCRHRRCVNPAHLESVSRAENNSRNRSFATVNAAKTHCPAGHKYDAENTYINNGKRHCRPCNRSRVARYKARKLAQESGVATS